MHIMNVIDKVNESFAMLIIVKPGFLVWAKMFCALSEQIVAEPRRPMGEALSNKCLPLIMKLWQGKIFVDRFEQFLKFVAEILELAITASKCKIFEHGAKNLMIGAGLGKDELVKSEPDK